MSDVTPILSQIESGDPLAAEDPVAARVVGLRHFAGLSIEDAASALGVSRATAYRHWTYARAWLRDAVSAAKSD